MRKIVIICGLLLAASSHAASLELSCPSSDTEKEQVRIRSKAPGLVMRKGAHQLQVRTQAGIQTYKDKAPYDEGFDGETYAFCDRKEGFILLLHNDGVLFTGTLINEATGAVAIGGQSVLFSEDRRAYLASEQPDGSDGNTWNIYAVNGKLSWSGYEFIETARNSGQMYAYLDTPTWSASGELSANATCVTDEASKWKVKLVKKNESWDWAPRKQCPIK